MVEGCHHVRARRVRILERTRLFHKCCQSILAECQVIFKESGIKWCLIFLFPTIMFLSWLMAKLKDLSCSLTLNKLEWQFLVKKIRGYELWISRSLAIEALKIFYRTKTNQSPNVLQIWRAAADGALRDNVKNSKRFFLTSFLSYNMRN